MIPRFDRYMGMLGASERRGANTTVVTPRGTTAVDGTGVKTTTPGGTPVNVKTGKGGDSVEVGGMKVNPGSVSVPGVANIDTHWTEGRD